MGRVICGRWPGRLAAPPGPSSTPGLCPNDASCGPVGLTRNAGLADSSSGRIHCITKLSLSMEDKYVTPGPTTTDTHNSRLREKTPQ